MYNGCGEGQVAPTGQALRLRSGQAGPHKGISGVIEANHLVLLDKGRDFGKDLHSVLRREYRVSRGKVGTGG